MKAINNWSEVKETGGEIMKLPAGGYICKIKKCEEKPNKYKGGTHLEILFDITEGDYKGWFADDWKRQDREDKFWHGIIRQNVPNEDSPKYDLQCGFFKRFVNAVEAGNSGYHWNWDETGLKGKLIGVIFREVERESAKGTRYMTTQADSITSVDAIRAGKFKVPAPKMMATPAASDAPTFTADDDLDGDLPF